MRARRHLRAGLRPATPGGPHEGLDRGGHARGRLPGPARRARHHPHPPALRQRAGRDAPAHPGAVRRAGALSGALRRHRGLRAVGHLVPAQPRGQGEVRSGANAYILANHGVLVLGGDEDRPCTTWPCSRRCALDYLLAPAHRRARAASVPAPIREVAFAKLRADQKKLARQVAEAAAAPPPQPLPPLGGDGARPLTGDGAAAPPRRRRRRAPAAAAAPADERRRGRGRRAGAAAAPAGRRSAISRYPDVAAVYGRPGRPGAPAAAAAAPRAMADYLDYFDSQLRAAPRSSPARPPSSSPAACSTTWPSTTPSPSPSRRPRAPTCGTPTATATSTSCRPAGPTVLGSNYAPVRDQVIEVLRAVRARHRAVPRVRAQAGGAGATASCRRSRCSACWARAPRASWPPSARRARSPARSG